MNCLTAMLTGAGLGAGAMYFLDPDLGTRRRAVACDRLGRLPDAWQDAVSVTARDLRNRAVGFASEARARLRREDIDDHVLLGRVRSKLGFLVRHPSAVEVAVANRRVILRGAVLADEIEQLIDGVRAVRGVESVENGLAVHAAPGDISALQGDKPTGEPLDIMQRRWSPATRFLVGAAGTLLMYSISRRTEPAVLIPGALLLGFTAYGLGGRRAGELLPRRGRAPGENEIVAGWTG